MGTVGQVVLVRHGECVYEDCGRVAGLVDTELTDAGRQRATRCAQLVRDLGLRSPTVLTSPLTRAMDTARVVATALRAPVQPRWELLDRHVGAWTGWRVLDIERAAASRPAPSEPDQAEPPALEGTHPASMQITYGWHQWPAHARRPAESLFDVRERLTGFVDGPLRSARSNGDVVVVSHAAPLRALIALIVESSGRGEAFLAPGTITRVVNTNQSEGLS